MKKKQQATWLILIIFALMCSGCSTSESPSSRLRRFTDLLAGYPGTEEPLQLMKLDGLSLNAVPYASYSPDVFIVVHPGYALFFREPKRSKYTEAKYNLLLHQFKSEAMFIRNAARSGSILILIVPGNYDAESIAPQSYTYYLNAMADGQPVFYLFSESAANGSISANDMVELYRFMDGVKARKVMIGGGFIGRCQKEFYKQATSYLSKTTAYIVPEISTISPDDISENEAGQILESIRHRDYSLVRKFINRKLKTFNFLSIPPKDEAIPVAPADSGSDG